MNMPASVAALLDSLRSASASPRLIWYGEANERVELSGRVLDNWIAKTSNLLLEELDAGPHTVVALDMPPHWKTLVWALACWQVGAVTALDPATAAPSAIRLRMEPGADPGDRDSHGPVVVLVAPGALDMRWPGDLPAGAVDYAAEVRSFGDVYAEQPADPHAPLIADAAGQWTFDDLAGSPLAAEGGGNDDAGVWLIPGSLPLRTVLGAAVRIWSHGGSVVLVHPNVEVTQRLAEGERVTARLAV